MNDRFALDGVHKWQLLLHPLSVNTKNRLFGRGCAFVDHPILGIGEREEGTEHPLKTGTSHAMAYKRSITSSDDDSTGPKFTKERTDSSESAQSGTSAKYRWYWDYSSKRRGRLPESPSPSPVESSEDDKENVHPALMDVGEQEESEEEEDTSSYPVYLVPPQPIEISDDSDESLVEIIQRAAQSSYNGPPGFEPSSSAAAVMQLHLNHAHRRIEQLEAEVGQRQYAQEAVQAENVELADRVSQLVVLLAVVVLGVLVVALLRGWM